MTAVLWHTCEDGHSWREQPGGGVSPSWGLALTSVRFDQAPDRCPEPERFAVPNGSFADGRGIECPDCGHRGLPFDMFEGISCTPWEVRNEAERTGHSHEPPPPVCGKPPIATKVWVEGNRRKGIGSTWAPAATGGQAALC